MIAAVRVAAPASLHVGIIMDGNGRWATARGLPRETGHRHGARAVERAVEAAPRVGIGTLTLYAFSADNWHRPQAEVAGLMRIFERYVREQRDRCRAEGVRFSLVGRRDRLSPGLLCEAESLEQTSASGRTLHLRLAIDYSGREAIWRAAVRLLSEGRGSRDEFAAAVSSGNGAPADVPDVDLLIRTGGERRLSDFLLWESAYAELWFTDTPWPEFTEEELGEAIADFHRRERRFGRIAAT